MEAAKPTEPWLSLETPSTNLQYHIHHHQLPKSAVRLEFKCNYCHRKYHSLQALGGHQNAHRRERATTLAQSSRYQYPSTGDKAAMAAFAYSSVKHRHGYRPVPFSSSLLDPNGSLNNLNTRSGIDIQLVHSMMHKATALSSLSSSNYSSSSHLYGQHGWSRTTPTYHRHHGRRGQLFDGGLVVGEHPPCVTNELIINIGERTVGSLAPDGLRGGGRLKTNEEELEELDLSLKL